MFQMYRDSEAFGPAFPTEKAVRDWFWSDAGKAAMLALPGVDDVPPCAEAQSVFAVRRARIMARANREGR